MSIDWSSWGVIGHLVIAVCSVGIALVLAFDARAGNREATRQRRRAEAAEAEGARLHAVVARQQTQLAAARHGRPLEQVLTAYRVTDGRWERAS
jgi:hypothetical protein